MATISRFTTDGFRLSLRLSLYIIKVNYLPLNLYKTTQVL